MLFSFSSQNISLLFVGFCTKTTLACHKSVQTNLNQVDCISLRKATYATGDCEYLFLFSLLDQYCMLSGITWRQEEHLLHRRIFQLKSTGRHSFTAKFLFDLIKIDLLLESAQSTEQLKISKEAHIAAKHFLDGECKWKSSGKSLNWNIYDRRKSKIILYHHILLLYLIIWNLGTNSFNAQVIWNKDYREMKRGEQTNQWAPFLQE